MKQPYELAAEIFDTLVSDYKNGYIDTLMELHDTKNVILNEYAYNNTLDKNAEDELFEILRDQVDGMIINSELNDLPDFSELDGPEDYDL